MATGLEREQVSFLLDHDRTYYHGYRYCEDEKEYKLSKN